LKQNISALITIFGATGDLSYRKLFPSIYNLFQKGYFEKSIAIIGTGLDELTTEEFRQQVKLSIKNQIEKPRDIDEFLHHLFYQQQNVNQQESYEQLLQLSQDLDEEFNLEGKEMIQNIERLRFGNTIFEPLWNNNYISNIQITSSETLGIENRGTYYESSGALKDMVQNHLLQMVSLLAMEVPSSRKSNDIRKEKVRVLKSLKSLKKEEIKQNFVRGQYDEGVINNETVLAYKDEPNVDSKSITETFVAGKIEIDNSRWSGVPFYIRTGKRMYKKAIQIVIEFKKNPMNIYYDTPEENESNLLVINVQPSEGFSLCVNGKKSNQNDGMQVVKLPYIMPTKDKMNTVDAYENLIYDVLIGDQTNFSHWEELMYSWKFIDKIKSVWNEEPPAFPNYKSGSYGPNESEKLLDRDGLNWWNNL